MNKLKGDLYEIYVRNYLNQDKIAYLWKDTPEQFLIEAKLIHSNNENRLRRKKKKNMLLENPLENPLVDVGVDIFQVDSNNNFTLVQCKNGYENGITIEHLSGFYMMMANHYHLNGSVYYTSKLSQHITENHVNQKISYIKLPILENKSNIKNILPIVPYDYQIEASNKIKEYFDQNNNAILSLPCGCGKTFTSYLISQKFQSIVIFSPLKQFAKQNMTRYIEYGYNNPHLLIDSDGTRNSHEISNFIISNNNSVLLSATYNSVDKILEIIHLLKNPLIIVDEFHNLSKNNVINEDDPFYKLLETDHKFLFMSATPRVYELEDEFEDGNLGEIVYNLSFSDAIEKNYICDYKIYLPSVSEDNTALIDDIKTEIDISLLDDHLKAKCMFLFKALLHHGSRKCIVYCQNIDEIETMIFTMGKMNEYYLMDFNMSSITSLTNRKKREDILDHFIESDNVELIFSVRILDECIDITKCDSIYITYPTTSKIRTIQRMCRCIRKDKDNKFKIGHVYIWCDQYAEILDTLSGIKEYDIFFKDKLSVLDLNWKGEKNIDKVIEDKEKIVNFVVGIKEFKQLTFYERLEYIKTYINQKNKRPSYKSKDFFEKKSAKWLSTMLKYYRNNNKMFINVHKRSIFEDFLEEYKDFFKSNVDFWFENFEKCKKYIKDKNKRPSEDDKDPNIRKTGKWLNRQFKNYRNNKKIIKTNENVRMIFEDFIEEYKEFFKSKEEIWFEKFEESKKYIIENKKRPYEKDKDPNIRKYGLWLNKQLSKYKENIQIMKTNEDIRNIFGNFLEEYKEFLKSREEIWFENFEEIKKYIIKNKKPPSVNDKDPNIRKTGLWLNRQLFSYKEIKDIMKTNEYVRNVFKGFLEEYKDFLKSREEIWYENFEENKKYIIENKKRPYEKDKDPNIRKYGIWLNRQLKNYRDNKNIMKINEDIRNIFKKFLEEYKDFFKSKEEIWYENFEENKKYIIENKKRPYEKDKDPNIRKKANWISKQIAKYKEETEDDEKGIIFRQFLKDYHYYFRSNEEIWFENFEENKKYIMENKKRPSDNDKDPNIRKKANWISKQIAKYKEETEDEKGIIFRQFLKDYQYYFRSNEEIWLDTFEEVKKIFLKEKGKKFKNQKDPLIKKLRNWYYKQEINYNKKIQVVWTNPIIREEWEKFQNDYK